jgi:hypothetical protein
MRATIVAAARSAQSNIRCRSPHLDDRKKSEWQSANGAISARK